LQRELSLAAVGEIFGVSPVMVYKWEQGSEPDEDGKVLGKPIAAELVPLILRWVDSEEMPTAEELARRKTARKGRSSAARKSLGSLLREAHVLTSR
jgi:hypothetical protein